MKSYWLFLIPAILCSLCSDQIDQAFGGEGRLRTILLIFSAGSFLICLIPVLAGVMD